MFTQEPVSQRPCTGDTGDGIEYVFKGERVNIRQIIEDVRETDDHYISALNYFDDGNPSIVVFVVENSTRNDAFV